MEYIERSSHLEYWNYDFKPKTILSGIFTTYGSTLTLDDFRDL